MKKLLNLVFAAALICGASVFTSCSKDDNPVNPATNLSGKIIGKWMIAERDGIVLPTNKKMVITFVSATKAYVSTSRDSQSEVDPMWVNMIEADVTISSNKVTLSFHPDEHNTSVHELTITAIDATEFSANEKVSVTIDGKAVISKENGVCFTRVNRDYNEAIIGIWEGQMTSEQDAYSDGKVHRWEYKADGTYVYYSLNEAGEWVPSDNTLDEYFVDGSLLCMRWIDNEQDNREWWEIVSIKNDVMKWKGLRQKEDGTTYTATFEMTKVE